jgi:hypothetical protein
MKVKAKVKLFLYFNWAPRHEDVLGEWRYSSTHFLTSALDGGEWSTTSPGRKRMMMKKKNIKEKTEREEKLNNNKVHMYILPKQKRTVNCYKTDPSSRQVRRPMTNKTATVWTIAKI